MSFADGPGPDSPFDAWASPWSKNVGVGGQRARNIRSKPRWFFGGGSIPMLPSHFLDLASKSFIKERWLGWEFKTQAFLGILKKSPIRNIGFWWFPMCLVPFTKAVETPWMLNARAVGTWTSMPVWQWNRLGWQPNGGRKLETNRIVTFIEEEIRKQWENPLRMVF